MAQQAELERTKQLLVEQFAAMFVGQPPQRVQELRARIGALLDTTPEGELMRVMARLRTTGADYAYYPPEPFARRLQREVGDMVLAPGSGLLHGERLARVGDRPVVFLPNHLSYSDANLFEILLARAGHTALADRLTVIAGPKVYSDPLRRFLSLTFGTIKVAQSTSRASDEAVMSLRQVAEAAHRSLELAHARLAAGDALLVFPEGTRSRTGALQKLLPAVARYLEAPGALVVPVGLSGSERLIPLGEMRLQPAVVHAAIGEPIECERLRAEAGDNRTRMMTRVGQALAALLPAEYRGAYG